MMLLEYRPKQDKTNTCDPSVDNCPKVPTHPVKIDRSSVDTRPSSAPPAPKIKPFNNDLYKGPPDPGDPWDAAIEAGRKEAQKRAANKPTAAPQKPLSLANAAASEHSFSEPAPPRSVSVNLDDLQTAQLFEIVIAAEVAQQNAPKKPLFSTTLELAEQGGSKNTQQEITVEEISLHALVGLNTVVGSLFRGVVERAFPAYLTALTFPLDAVLLTQQPYRRTSRQQDLFPVTRFSFQASKNVAAAWSTNFAKAQVAFLKRMGCTEGLTKVVESHSTRFHVNPFFKSQVDQLATQKTFPESSQSPTSSQFIVSARDFA